jgi:hypothetical protein
MARAHRPQAKREIEGYQGGRVAGIGVERMLDHRDDDLLGSAAASGGSPQRRSGTEWSGACGRRHGGQGLPSVQPGSLKDYTRTELLP